MRLPLLLAAALVVLVAATPAAAAPPPPSWMGSGPSGGAVSQVEIDARHPATMYAGTLGAGVFKPG